MMSVTATVIVLTYNQAATIARTLESVLSQRTPFSFEVLIGEDASTDETRRICADYEARYPSVIRLMPAAPNKGIVGNYFDCLEASRGEYITDCAGDDYWANDTVLATLVGTLQSHPEASIAYGELATSSNSGIGDTAIVPSRKLMVELLNSISLPPIILSAAAYRRSDALSAISSDPAMVKNVDFGCEDLPLILALLKRGDAVRIAAPMLCYDPHPTTPPARITGHKLRWFEREKAMRLLLARHYHIKRAEILRFRLYEELRLVKYRLLKMLGHAR